MFYLCGGRPFRGWGSSGDLLGRCCVALPCTFPGAERNVNLHDPFLIMATRLLTLRRWWITALIFIGISCGNNENVLEGVDMQSWKQDRGGCKNLRAGMITSLEEQRNKLLRLSEMEIVELLGKPDENELYVRSQQFYRYFLEPGPSCGIANENARVLVVRFNALGICHEVTVE